MNWYRLLVFAALAIAATGTLAQDEVNDEYQKEVFATCAAVQSAVAEKIESAMSESILVDAKWFADLASDIALVETKLRRIQKGYDEGNLSWQKLVDLAEDCSAMKQEISAAEPGHQSGALAQEAPLLADPQDSMQSWDYELLLECSVKYELVLGALEGLGIASGTTQISESNAALIQEAYEMFFMFGVGAAEVQGLSSDEINTVYESISDKLTEQIMTPNGPDTQVLASYLNDGKKICKPYFEKAQSKLTP